MNLEEFISRRFEDMYIRRCYEVEMNFGPFEGGAYSDSFEWDAPRTFKKETIKGVLAVAANEQEAETALHCIFAKLELDHSKVKGVHRYFDYTIYKMNSSSAIMLARDNAALREIIYERVKG